MREVSEKQQVVWPRFSEGIRGAASCGYLERYLVPLKQEEGGGGWGG